MLEIKWTVVQPDDSFFFTIYANSRKAEMSSWGWTQEEQWLFMVPVARDAKGIQYEAVFNRLLSGSN